MIFKHILTYLAFGFLCACLLCSTPVHAQQLNPGQQSNQGRPTSIQQQAVQQPAATQPPQPQQPFAPLSADMQKYLDSILSHWSQSTDSIDMYRCTFKRWTFEGQPRHTRYATGFLGYSKPDQGVFKVEELFFDKSQNNGPAAFQKVPGMFGEWWVCDGKGLHEYDESDKTVTIYELPAEMQGKNLFNSPLPFLFGVKADEIKNRYWVRPGDQLIGADGKPNEPIVTVEAFPKYQGDAQNYSKVVIYLDRKEFLPISLELFMPNWTKESDHREVFEFENRERNASFFEKVQAEVFRKQLIPMDPPKDWKVIRHPAPLPAQVQQGIVPQAQQVQGNPLSR
jgi:TIGR03009 family protein